MWLACGTPRRLRGQSRCVCGSSSPGLASLCARAFGCSRRPARPPLCPAADAVREPWAGSALPLATESFLAWGLRGSFPPRKPPSVTISLMTVTHSHCSEAFSPRRGAGRGSWVLGHSGSHGEAAGSRRATGRRGTWGTVSFRLRPGCRSLCRLRPLGAAPPLPWALARGCRWDADSRGRAGPGAGEPSLSPLLQRASW